MLDQESAAAYADLLEGDLAKVAPRMTRVRSTPT